MSCSSAWSRGLARSSEVDPRAVTAGLEARARSLADSSILVIAGAIIVGLALRLVDLGRESFWLDEAGRAAIAALPLGDIPRAVAVIELSPPLYHLLLHGWIQLFGDGDVAVRLFSAVLVFPTVPLAWSIGAAIGGRRVAVV